MGQSLEREIVMKTAFDLKGKRAVISAGASGIGYAIAPAAGTRSPASATASISLPLSSLFPLALVAKLSAHAVAEATS